MGLSRLPSGMAAYILTAALACLQPGIDPVFLTLVSAAHGIDSSDHGLIVGATQMGMALGGVLVWRLGTRLPGASLHVAALVALAASLATAAYGDPVGLIAIRVLYGFAMGIIYTQAMSLGAAMRPTGAYGAVFLIQLILSTFVALVLPMVAKLTSPGTALAVLGLAPFSALLMTFFLGERDALHSYRARPELRPAQEEPVQSERVPPSGWALAWSSFLFICATMMVWSFTGALATQAGIGEETIGWAVAVGSVAGALTATGMLREKPLVPLPLSGLLAGLALLAPIALTQPGQSGAFILSVILLNIGSTAIIIRTSGAAAAASAEPLFRRLVACAHPMGMIMGPAIGSAMTFVVGDHGLLIGAVSVIVVGCGALAFSVLSQKGVLQDRAGPAQSRPDTVAGSEPAI